MSRTRKHLHVSGIDSKAVYGFWEARAKSYLDKDKTGLSNLEPDPALGDEKLHFERQVMDAYFSPHSSNVCLDLGAGHGSWSAYFSGRVRYIDCVEYSETMIRIARGLLDESNINNVTYFHSKAQEYLSDNSYDIILISGLLIYLDSIELEKLLINMTTMLAEGGRIILRDGTAREKTYIIKDRFSETLKTNYSAFYRTSAEYIAVFSRHGFKVLRHQNVFPDESPLNKWIETVLRIYEFKKME